MTRKDLEEIIGEIDEMIEELQSMEMSIEFPERAKALA
ncbi:hypothetical protein Aboo_0508 [Aciduliprofundum boonei T469]|uniref:Uncharacterized protein n=1 Tax=Aciduliprofundum boonei (strain DSM 19572 / T469) TaxID=439481 RepID=B5IA47_ACIB4|nr:hypothetical protein Aboo_0508 [Aciduliprofundum boonei T469]EDY36840.1 hypothetical protein ABOONEI_1761 [Aciduliprofundum boonei T469]